MTDMPIENMGRQDADCILRGDGQEERRCRKMDILKHKA